MGAADFTYFPKDQSISYMEVERKAGYVSGAIHMHDHGEIVLVTSHARCRITNNGNTVTVQTPAIWINRAGSFHEVTEVLEGTYCSRVVFFHPLSLSGIPREMLYEDLLFGEDLFILPLTDEQALEFVPLFDLLRDRSFAQKRLMTLAVLCQMAQLVGEGAVPVTVTSGYTYIFQVIDYLRVTDEKITLAELAPRFHVSQTKLKQDFKTVTGLSVKGFQSRIRIQKALVLLETTDQDQAAIACACGFSDESHFIESFRKAYGMTPGAYRHQRGGQ